MTVMFYIITEEKKNKCRHLEELIHTIPRKTAESAEEKKKNVENSPARHLGQQDAVHEKHSRDVGGVMNHAVFSKRQFV